MTSFLQMILDKLVAFWDGVEQGFTAVFQWLKEFYSLYSWSVGVFLGLLWFAITYVWDVVTWIGEQLPTLFSAASTAADVGGGVQIPGALGQAFSVANAFFPLTEAFGFAVAIGPIWMTAVIIRCVKSWVPGWN
jgi:hypothetical protein